MLFLSVLLAVLGSLHLYLWLRLIWDPGWPEPWLSRATVLLFALALSFPLTMVLTRRLPPGRARLLTEPVFLWIGLMFLLIVHLGAIDAVRAPLSLLGLWPFGDTSVREARVIAWAVIISATGIGFVATRQARRINVRALDLSLQRLPPTLSGTTIVQLSDLHIGPTLGRPFVDAVVKQVNDLHPDVVVITGDLADAPAQRMLHAAAPLRTLRATHGVYFVTGNHEYYVGVESWLHLLSELGVRVLRNERVTLERHGAAFDLAGVDDRDGQRLVEGHGTDLARALTGRDPDRVLILLAHRPSVVLKAAPHGVDLQLSGHTHGGQIWPFRYAVRLVEPYVEGLHRVGSTWLYVSRGTGFWGPPMRLWAPPEITKITLSSKTLVTDA